MADGQRHLSFNISETKYGTIHLATDIAITSKVSWIGQKRNILPYPFKTVKQSMITENMAAVHFPSNALRSKIFMKPNGCLVKDRRTAGGRFVYSAKISHHKAILHHLYSVIFK